MALGVAWLLVRLHVADKHMLHDTYVDPVADFFRRYGKAAFLILLLVGFYRVSDIVLGVISNVFYQDMGFSKEQIATVTKVFGIWMTILGGFLGGFPNHSIRRYSCADVGCGDDSSDQSLVHSCSK